QAAMISAREYARGQVAVTTVTYDGDDHGVLDLFGHAQRNMQRTARRDAGKDAFLAREAASHLFCLGLAYVFEAIDRTLVVNARQICLGPLPDARNLRTFVGLAANDLDRGILFLEETRATHDGARRAHAA